MSRPRHLLLVAALGAWAPRAGADEEKPESRAAIQTLLPSRDVFVGEVVELAVSFEYDEPWFAKHATASFRQPMELPVRAIVPAFRSIGDALRVLAPGVDPAGLTAAGRQPGTFALGDEVVRATAWSGSLHPGDRIVPGSSRAVMSYTRRFQATREGSFPLAAPSLEFAWAERFETDLLGVRMPVDPQRVTVIGTESRLTVRPVPAEGRPPTYQGLIGRYTLTASADRTHVEPGDPLRLTVVMQGAGNHETLPIPGFEGLEAFHVLGTLEEQTPTLRTLQIDLAALDASTREIPALTLAFFDPERAAYAVARSEPIPIRVHGASAPPVSAPPAPPEPPASNGWLLPLALGVVTLLGAVLLLRRRHMRARPSTEPDGRLEALLTRLRCAAGTPEGGLALIDLLAWQLGVAPAAVVAADLALRLVRSGLPEELAERAAAAVEACVAERYAGTHAVAEALPRDLLADLEHALRAQRRA